MPQRLSFPGRYVLVDGAKLRERVNRSDDARHIFYEAMLETDSYGAYEAVVGAKTVVVETWNPPKLVSGHDEIRHVRNDRGWIEDEGGGPGGRRRSPASRPRRLL